MSGSTRQLWMLAFSSGSRHSSFGMGAAAGGPFGTRHGALLGRLLRCAACNCGMSHSFTRRGPRNYRYYVCQRAQKRGWQACPSPSVPAGDIERFVIDQIKCIGRDPLLIRETLSQARRHAEDQIQRLKGERTSLVAQLRNDHAELGRLAASSIPGDSRLTDAHDHICDTERRVSSIDDELAVLDGDLIDEPEVAAALADFDGVWDCLAPREQARTIELLVEQVVYDGENGNVSITFRPTGIRTLASELAQRKEEAA